MQLTEPPNTTKTSQRILLKIVLEGSNPGRFFPCPFIEMVYQAHKSNAKTGPHRYNKY